MLTNKNLMLATVWQVVRTSWGRKKQFKYSHFVKVFFLFSEQGQRGKKGRVKNCVTKCNKNVKVT